MIAKLILRYGPGKSDIQIRKMPIFNDCVECGSRREKSAADIIILKGTRQRISNISCSCKQVTAHQDLRKETELIDLFTEAGIFTVREII